MKLNIKDKIPYYNKIRTIDELEGLVRNFQSFGNRVVHTNGCFDLLHLGHVAYLYEASSYGDILIVGVNTDKSVRKLKGKRRPLITSEERASLVASLAHVDFVYFLDDINPARTVERLKPNVHVKGGDYKGREDKTAEYPICQKYNIQFVTTNTYGNLNSTNKIRHILDTYDRQDVRRENVKNKRKED